jgi:hypothetical protein
MNSARPTEIDQSSPDFRQPTQASLPGFEPAALAPVMPTPGTRPAEALAMLIANECIDQRDFLAVRAGWRLAAAVFELRAFGWRIHTHHVPITLANGEAAYIARYALDRSCVPASQTGYVAPGLVCWLAAVAPLFIVGLLLLSRCFG